ncbi:MAG TPA: hypothetical protein VGT40_10700 [Methylomirabilota bacterium]|jgi:hypothetical protein|nr:hypothetical protein [Methylomirabilota bacterium]
MWLSLVVQCVGLTYDVIWHGLLNPRFEAVTVAQMVRHLGTVHLPLYIGVVGMLLSSAWALVDQLKRSEIGVAVPVAFVGSLVQTAGESWHAYTHLQLTTHSGPIAFTVSFFGMLIVACALVLGWRRGRRRVASGVEGRRAA